MVKWFNYETESHCLEMPGDETIGAFQTIIVFDYILKKVLSLSIRAKCVVLMFERNCKVQWIKSFVCNYITVD